jgi:hypothetical protein
MFLSGQLGTAQLGLAQLGQFKASFAISINASAQSPQPATATPLVSGGRVSGGVPLAAARYISAQLGTAQLGLAQLGQFEKQFPLGVNAVHEPPVAVVATAFTTGEISGGDPVIQIAGASQRPQPVTATALVGGGALNTPGVIGGVEPSGFWWWWMPGEFTLKMIDDMLADGDGQEMNERRT